METTLTNIELKKSYSQDIANDLNMLLSNIQVNYMNMRSFHWNIRGKHFFLLHEKFEEFYNDMAAKADEVAERILTLGFAPLDSFKKYLDHAEIKPVEGISDGELAVDITINSLSILLKKEREILELAAENSDEGTASLMSDFIAEQEKLLWMLNIVSL